ncbi:MAG: hypothetical protein EA390_02745 [Balneolaceae bacterium]|nr:MAG: hypothetical protein EA390_02745 [Balneolaceae bacterium]
MKFQKYLILILLLFLKHGILIAQSGTMEQALRYFKSEQYSRAIPLLETLAEMYPDYEEAWILLAASHLRNDTPEIADFKAMKALEYHSESTTLLWIRGEAHVQQELIHEAIPFYFKTLEVLKNGGEILLFPVSKKEVAENLARLYQYGSVAYFRNGDLESAMKYAENAVYYSPDTLPYHKNLLYMLYESGLHEVTLKYADRALERFPGNTTFIRIKASVYNRLEDFENLKKEFREIYEQAPEDLENAMLFAEILIANQQSAEAEEIYQNLISIYPDEKKIYFALATLYQRRFTLENKLETLKMLLERFPDDEEVLTEKASLFMLMNEYEEARRVYSKLHQLSGEDLKYSLLIASAFKEEEKTEEALSVYQELFQRHPDNEELMMEYGWMLADLEKWNELASATGYYYRMNRSPSVLELKGYAIYKNGDHIAARDILQQAVERKSFSARSLWLLSKISFQDSLQQSYEYITEAIRIVFRDMTFEQKIIETRLRTEGLHSDPVSMNFESMERLNRLSKEIFYFFIQNFKKDEILPVLNWIVSTYSNSSVLLSMTGAWFESIGDYERSLQLFTDSVRYRSSNIDGHMGMARVYEIKNQTDSAILSYERALSLDSENPVIYRSLIRLYRSKGELNRLVDRWQLLYRNQPKNIVLREYLIEALHRSDRFEEARQLTADI